jgi:hypothetical protein
MTALVVALSAIAIGCAGMVLVGAALLIEIRRARIATEFGLAGLNQTHMLGFEALTMSLERLEKRVTKLEEA